MTATASAVSAASIGGPLGYLGEAVAAAAVVRTAARLGVLDRLDGAAPTVTELAVACGLDKRGAGLLLAAMQGLGLIEEVGGSWRSALPDLPALARTTDMWTSLDELTSLGRPLVRGDTPSGAQAFYPGAVIHLGAMLASVADRAAELLPPAVRVLDVGAGAAPWSLALAARDPACFVTAVDLPAVVIVTRRAVRTAGRLRQFRFVEGDLFDIELGCEEYDLAIVGNLCHLFDEATNRRLLDRLFRALVPGGTLAVIDVMPGDGPAPRWVALYELGLMLRTASGRVHRLAVYLDWLHDTGFEPPERHLLDEQAQAVLLVARTPVGG
ncbi:MAG TPA: class I SAM-dependent methyltransferase [Nakamurella sp.]